VKELSKEEMERFSSALKIFRIETERMRGRKMKTIIGN